MNTQKICAVVVTCNRLELLKKCINCLRSQTVKPDEILLIDNGCIDGTIDWLATQTDLTVISQENTGSSGGFYEGFKRSFEKGHDWIWAMDDDAFPEKSCLENLLKSKNLSNKKDVVIAPIVVEEHTVDYLHRGYIDLDNPKYPLQTNISINNFNGSNNDEELSFSSWIGMLLGREIIKRIGYPGKDFFIFNDDVEYSVRITTSGFKIYLEKNAIIYHKVYDEHADLLYPTSVTSTAESAAIVDGHKSKFERKLTLLQTRYDQKNKINIFLFLAKRNLIRILLKYKGWSYPVLKYILSDMSNAMLYIVFSRRNRLILLKLYSEVYKQGITGNFKNDIFFKVRRVLSN